ncbi:hypothetical protein [Gulbenkiania mobilis]|uniref:hypothetical protein n=1 Tax=Gulbenkiania mobilis TaxID=397457 RepID=UPI0006BBA449|nr:hypothetical protein [Gulbenkiania mobilis]
MHNIITFPSSTQTHTIDPRDLKRMTGQTELRNVLTAMSAGDAADLKLHVFQPWPVLREMCENASFFLTAGYPSLEGKGLLESCLLNAMRNFMQTTQTTQYSKPEAFIRTLCVGLSETHRFQVVGASMGGTRKSAWDTFNTPLPVWMKKHDYLTVEFIPLDRSDMHYSNATWIYIACRLMPAYGNALMGSLLESHVRAS